MENLGIFIKKKELILLSLVSVIFFLLLLYKLDFVPPGINGDEASIGYNSILISQTLRDENKRLLPLFVLTLNGKDWKQPVTIYSTSLLFKVFGPSLFTLRLVSVLFVLFSLLVIYFILKELFEEKYSLTGLIFFISSPLVLIQSHLALENITPVFFICLWLLSLIKFFKEKKNIYLILTGIFLGVSMYSYFGMRLMVPVYFLLTIFSLLILKIPIRQKINSLKFFCLGLVPFIFLIFIANFKYPGAFLGNNSPSLPTNYQNFFLPFLSSFDPSFLFVQGDATNYHSTGIHGMFLLFTVPFFLTGIYQIIKSSNFINKFILITFFATPFLFGLTDQIHRASRLMVLIPFFVVICTNGAIFILNKSRVIFYILVLLIIIGFVDFLSYYWNEYPNQVKSDFSSTSNVTFKALSRASQKYNLKPAVLWDYYQKEDIAAKFFEKAYFENPLIKWRSDIELSNNIMLLTSSADREILEEKSFQEIKLPLEEYSIFIPKKISRE